MIVVRMTKNDDENKKILEMFKGCGFINNNTSSLSYVLEENNQIVGGCNFNIINSNAILNFLVIDKNRRKENLGDGLLRAVLNYFSRSKIEKVYFIGESDYFIKNGFSKVKQIDEDLASKIEVNSDTILECDVEIFFDKGCRCKRS